MSLELPIERIVGAPEARSEGRHAQPIGMSRQGRPILAYRFGRGEKAVSLIAGCHADEPVGPAMLSKLVGYLAGQERGSAALEAATWLVVPHVNPDGAARNTDWIDVTVPVVDCKGQEDRGYDLLAYLEKTIRELPGDDVEFGFPRRLEDREARPENRAVADFLRPQAPFHLHSSFHGMGIARGPWFLIEEAWIRRTSPMRESLREMVRQMGYEIYDVDRGGEKGFWRIDEGFTTRPDSRHMAAFFERAGDPEMAARFRPSSMEFVRSLGGDTLTLVSEMPLFLLPELEDSPADAAPPPEGGDGGAQFPRPVDRARRRDFVIWARGQLVDRKSGRVRAACSEVGIRPMPIRDQMRLQLAFLNQGLEAAGI